VDVDEEEAAAIEDARRRILAAELEIQRLRQRPPASNSRGGS